MKNSYNYKTFYTGTPSDLEECPIIYFSSTKDHDFKISLDRLKELEQSLLSKELVFCVKGKDGFYTKSLNGFEKFSFDLIVYCSSSLEANGTQIIGYTIFSEPQKTYTLSGNTFGKLIISVSFDRIEEERSDVIVNILNTYKTIQSGVDLRGSESYNYPISTSISFPEDSYIRYTGKLKDLSKDSSLVSLTDCGVAFNNGRSYSTLYINQEVNLDKDLYTHFYIGTYNYDLVIFKINLTDGSYCVSSLTKLNRFSKPYDYISGILDIKYISGWEFMYFSHSFLLFQNKKTQRYLIYSLDKGEFSEYSRYVIIDKFDVSGSCKFMTESELFDEIRRTCITPVKKSSSGYITGIDKREYTFLGKSGCWWELYKTSSNLYYYLSPYGCISSTSEMMIINERLFKTKDGIFFPIEFGHTYKYPVHGYPRDITDFKKVGIKISSYSLWESLDNTQEALLDGLRRKPIRSRYCFPDQSKLLGSLFGLIFYTENGLIYCY